MKNLFAHIRGYNTVGWAGPNCPCCRWGMKKRDAKRIANKKTRRTKKEHIKENTKDND